MSEKNGRQRSTILSKDLLPYSTTVRTRVQKKMVHSQISRGIFQNFANNGQGKCKETRLER